jgi:hypothetical protein
MMITVVSVAAIINHEIHKAAFFYIAMELPSIFWEEHQEVNDGFLLEAEVLQTIFLLVVEGKSCAKGYVCQHSNRQL